MQTPRSGKAINVRLLPPSKSSSISFLLTIRSFLLNVAVDGLITYLYIATMLIVGVYYQVVLQGTRH